MSPRFWRALLAVVLLVPVLLFVYGAAVPALLSAPHDLSVYAGIALALGAPVLGGWLAFDFVRGAPDAR